MLSASACRATSLFLQSTRSLLQPNHCAAALIHLARSSSKAVFQPFTTSVSTALEQHTGRWGPRAAMQALHSNSSVGTRAPGSYQHVRRAAVPCRAATSTNGNKSPSGQQPSQHAATGYLWHELYFWHCAGPWGNLREYVQPMDHSPEHVETKRR